ncbi:tumor necrosis factor receptor superfamily member 14-like isoform X4 [Thunnus albacares]|uniref:tumor necrosis factor receptor superfamily member 14-like isoform X4 n=1 Tax=Thunnus albacares TaxID=8236 RepID=UPI001CF61AA7|nr:tumor necrosis factor receptor superfamily member 14-like isoform X4 [Thunnus albacares]
MTLRRKPLTAATLLIIILKVFIGQILACHPTEYQTAGGCCPMCPAGSRVKTDCAEFRSTSCLPCTDGTYMNHPTARRLCFTCANCDAGSGLQIKTSCTSTSNTVCQPLEGFYCMDSTEDGCVKALKHTSCQPGQYIRQKGTALRDTECTDCSDGTFSDGTFTSCQPHTQCESLKLQLIKPGTDSADAECGEQSSHVIIIVTCVIVVLFVLFGIAGLVYFRKKKSEKKGNADISRQENTNGEMSEMLPGCQTVSEIKENGDIPIEEVGEETREMLNGR